MRIKKIIVLFITAFFFLSFFATPLSARDDKIGPRVRNAKKELKANGITVANAAQMNASRFSNRLIHINNKASIQTYIYVYDYGDNEEALLLQNGATVEIYDAELGIVQAWIPFNKIESVADYPFVKKITSPSYGYNRVASCIDGNNGCVTQGDSILRADELRALGFDGTGVKVGVISDGVKSWKKARTQGELPQNITTYGTCTGGGSGICDEGTAILEIIYDMAPGAELGFGAGLGSTLEFRNRVDDLMNTFGADIIIDDLGFYLEPYFEDGPVAEKVQQAVDNDVLFVSACGNDALNHYQGPYVDSGDGLGSHQISSGNNTFDITGSDVAVIVQWTNQFGAASDDYDLCLDFESPVECAAYNSVQDGNDDPVEARAFNCFFTCNLQIRLVSGSPQTIELFSLGADLNPSDRVETDSIFGHAAVPDVLATAAIDASDPGHDDIEYYSSWGPVEIFFPSYEVRPKPELTAIDGVDVGGFGGFPSPFYGTSAAAPHVAAAAAQLMGGFSTPQEVSDALMDSAVDLGTVGFDNIYGAGRVDVYAAAELLNDPPNAIIDSPASNITISEGDSVNFLGTCDDPNSAVGATFEWDFDGDSLVDSTAEDPGSIPYPSEGIYVVTFKCTDGFGVEDPTPDTRSITVEAIPIPPDDDSDGVPNADDNCPSDPNPGQEDYDSDGLGDVCDPDIDDDGALNANDSDDFNVNVCSDTDTDTCEDCTNGSYDPSNDGTDTDTDGLCNDGDPDDDNDGVNDDVPDNCPLIANSGQEDEDSDGLGDVCDPDIDGDGSLNADDSDDYNANVCSDTDSDTCEDCTNGSYDPSNDGADFDGDGQCDAGDPDDDNDGSLDPNDSNDNNPNVCSDTDSDTCEDCINGSYNPSNDGADFDGDGLCDAGDPDDDNDGSLDPNDSNDNNPNVCSDTDADTCDDCTNGSYNPANDGPDADADGICDAGDSDNDNDGVNDGSDNCPLIANPSQTDTDGDGLGNACDSNNNDGPLGDADGDSIINSADNCPSDSNTDQADNDNDSAGDVCDTDDDNDTVADTSDNCPLDANADQADNDGDGIGDVCDTDDNDGPLGDADGDTVNNNDDNCPSDANYDQADNDSDDLGDVCDDDDDNDGVQDDSDNCPLDANGDQADSDDDGLGDMCDPTDDSSPGDNGDAVQEETTTPSGGCSLRPSSFT